MADHSYYGIASTDATTSAGPPQKSHMDSDKIFVGGLSWQTTDDSLRYHFEQYGPVLSVEVMKDRVTGDPRGFAFVVFTDEKTVDLVMAEPRHEINHKVVDVKRAQARGVAPPSIHEGRRKEQQELTTATPEQLQNKIFVGGLPPHVDRDMLKQVFEQFGAVADAIVMMDQQQQRSRGFGFVTFENGTNGAHKALEAQPIDVYGRMAEVKLATPKGDQAPRTKPLSLGLRAGISGSSTGEFAGLAASYGRNGWRAGYGTRAFGAAGWKVADWEPGPIPDRSGFSFDAISQPPAHKRAKRQAQ